MIGSANWTITIRRSDINYAVNALSRFSMAPREGHLTAMKRVFGYLKRYPGGKILIDPEFRDWKNFHSEDYSWLEAYPHAVEEVPNDMPEPKGRAARITCYVDADHAHDKVTR